MNPKQAKELLRRYRLEQCTPEEKRIVESWLNELSEDAQWQWTEEEKASFSGALKERIEQEVGVPRQKGGLRRLPVLRIAAAAAVMGLIFVAVRGFFSEGGKEKPLLAAAAEVPELANEIQPGRTGAILTMADGAQVVLDSAATGVLAVQGGVHIINDSGEIRYTPKDNSSEKLLYNTISTPKGREYHLTLSDGTRVWLNAESSIRYPVKFDAGEREIEMRGEAYFEVAQQVGKEGRRIPFLVKISDGQHSWGAVQVLGTVFNVNAFRDQGTVKTTLLEGSVLVSSQKGEERLKPGQQSRINSDGLVSVVEGINTDAEVAWKNGFFSYDNTAIDMIMKDLARWYDIEVIYEGGVPPHQRFWGDIQRDASLSSVLKILEGSGIKFSREGKKITVLQI